MPFILIYSILYIVQNLGGYVMVVNEGKTYKVGIKSGRLGCSDAQDAFCRVWVSSSI